MTTSVPAATAYEYDGDGTTRAFSFPLKFLESADLKVSTVNSIGEETVKTLGTHYAVSGAGESSGGTVTFVAGQAPASGVTVKIKRRTQPKQTVDISDVSRTPGNTLEAQLDRLAHCLQELDQRFDDVEVEAGTPGLNSYLFGSGAPSDADDGENGDVYQDVSNGDQYKKASGTWTLQDNLTGPTGPQGEQGPAGDLGGFDPERVTVLETNFAPGDAKISFRRYATDPDGWLLANDDRTIGSASSGADVADAKCEDLFLALHTDYDNTELPILDSSGAPTTRGASAAADWAANKRLPMPNPMDRFPRMSSATRETGTTEANQNKTHNHTATFTGAELEGHSHGMARPRRRGANGNTTSSGWDGGDVLLASSQTHTTTSVSAGTPSGTVAVASDGGTEARPDSFIFTCLIKL